MDGNLKIVLDLRVGHNALKGSRCFLDGFTDVLHIGRHEGYVAARFAVIVSLGHDAVHVDCHFLHLADHGMDITLVILGHLGQSLRKGIEVLCDFSGLDKTFPHGLLDSFITKDVAEGISNRLQFFHNLAR